MPGMILIVLSVVLAAVLGETKPDKERAPDTVVFVCQHGNVKSLIAREWFNRLAGERGLAARAVSRGLTPAPSIPSAIGDALRRDGFDVSGFKARAFTAADLAVAARIVAIGVDPSSLETRGDVRVETWDGVPPATERYAASRDALRARIEGLLATLGTEGRNR